MKNIFVYLIVMATGLLLGSCMSDDLGLQTQTPFSVSTTNTPALVQAKDTVEFRLLINPSPYLSATSYRVSFQNTDSSLPVAVKIGRQLAAQGEWLSINDLSPWIAVRCDSVGQPKLLFYVKNQSGDLQTVEVSYTSAK